jgi:hypothetical protein
MSRSSSGVASYFFGPRKFAERFLVLVMTAFPCFLVTVRAQGQTASTGVSGGTQTNDVLQQRVGDLKAKWPN